MSGNTVIKGLDSVTPVAGFNVGDEAHNAIRVNVVAGGGGGGDVAVATAADPSYGEGDTVPLSVDLSGNLRTLGGGGGGGGNLLSPAFTLCRPTSSGTGFSGVIWPNSYTAPLPTVGSGDVGNISNEGTILGGVFAPTTSWSSVLIDVATVGTGSGTFTMEVGRVTANTTLTQVIASVAYTEGSSIGTLTNDPFTGAVISSTAYNMVSQTVITSRSGIGTLLQSLGGAANNTPSQLILACNEVAYYYVLITDVSNITKLDIAITPQ